MLKTILLASCGASLVNLLLASFACSQGVSITGSQCVVLATDCSTIVTAAQGKAIAIAVTDSKSVAKCQTTLPSDVSLPQTGTIVKCSFQNTGQNCSIGADQTSTSNCTATTSTATAQSDTAVTTSNGSPASVTTSDGTATSVNGTIETQDWEEIIRPSGKVTISCRAAR
jgi:hypothetical protein